MYLPDILDGVKSVAITGHVNPDGDCIGSCFGLYNYILDNYKDIKADVYLQIPGEDFSFISHIEDIKEEPIDKIYDVFFVMDCSSKDRFEPFIEMFDKAAKRVCIDHHVKKESFAEEALIIPGASSTCEVLYSILDEDKISKAVAECIYTGIIHDTGVFKYSCTSKDTMAIAGKMMAKGIDYSDIIDNSFYKKTYVQNQILGRALLESILFFDGRCIFSAISKSTMDFYNVNSKQMSGIIEQLRLTEGVEVAILLYQSGINEYKVSLRSKKYVDVCKIATYFGGGGHVKAAGCTMQGTVHDIINNLGAQIELQI